MTSGISPREDELIYLGRGGVGAVSGEEGSRDNGEAPQMDADAELDEYLLTLDAEEAKESGFENEWRQLREGGVSGDAASGGHADEEVEAGPNPILRKAPVKPDQDEIDRHYATHTRPGDAARRSALGFWDRPPR